MITVVQSEQPRFIALANIVQREGLWLKRTDERLFQSVIDPAWITQLEYNDELSERLEAFVSRFGRLQDTIGDKLIPSLLRLVAERPGSQLDNLNRAEKIGILDSTLEWLDTRNLRNKLVHEYMEDAGQFVQALYQAHRCVPRLIETYNAILRYVTAHVFATGLPSEINL